MGKISRRIAAAVLFASMLLTDSGQYTRMVRAAAGVFFVYCTESGAQGTSRYFSDALDIGMRYGGTVTVFQDFRLEPEKGQGYIYIPANMTLIISKDVRFALGDVDILLDGTIEVRGTLDLTGGEGMIEGNGEVAVGEGGCMIRRIPEIKKNGSICLWGSEIEKGQTLAASMIAKEKIAWKAFAAGEWSFAEPEKIPAAGTGLYSVIFLPRDKWTYQPVIFPACGQVTVKETKENTDSLPKGETKKQGTTDVDNRTVTHTVIVTKFVSRPSTIYTVSKAFRKKRPRFLHVARNKSGTRVHLKWSSVSGKTGYEIRFSVKKTMKKAEKKYVKKNKTTLMGLKKRKIYYLRVRAYKGKKKKRTYTKWSSIIKV